MHHKSTISVIIPAQNEQATIASFIAHTKSSAQTDAVKQIIVAVNGTDLTADRASKAGATVVNAGNSRALALNSGQTIATGDILYFLHADSVLPDGWDTQILSAYSAGYHSGCFRLRFDSDHPLLIASAWFTRFNWKFIRFGDQSLFVERDMFIKAGGYDEKMRIMEDREIIDRITQYSKFIVLPKYLITSARKYESYGYWRLQGVYVLINILYYLRLPQAQILVLYRKLLGS